MKIKPKIFFLASASSIHTYRWIELLNKRDIFNIWLLTAHPVSHNFSRNINIIRFPFKPPFGYFLNFLFLKYFLKKEKPILLHSFYATGYGFLGKMSGFKPYFISVWGSDILVFPFKSFFHKILLTHILTGSNQICSTTEGMKKIILSLGINKQITVIPFGVDTDIFIKKYTIKQDNKIVIGTIKSLEYVYGIDIMIFIFSELVKKSSFKLELQIYGNGTIEHELKKQVNDLGLEKNVFFNGYIEHNKVPDILNQFDIFFALSRSESFGVSVLEAMSCSLPVVTSDALGFSEIIDNKENGFIANLNNKEKLISYFNILIHDEFLRNKIGSNGRLKVKNLYSNDLFADNIIKFYTKNFDCD